MSQNRTSTDFTGTAPTSGQTGPTSGQTGTGSAIGTSSSGNGGTGTGTAAALAQTAQQYGEKISEAASQAKDFVTDKVSVVGDKLKELQNADLGEIAENAKDYARKNPGQAILISAAAGLLVGLIIRGRR
jgi:ElaB/YqjD/DUF883 family membrane-anchored ribosome-binding protein